MKGVILPQKESLMKCLTYLTKICQEFMNKGYQLADRNLINSNEISDIGFILGTNDAYALLESQISFGK